MKGAQQRLIFLPMNDAPHIIVGRRLRQARRERGWTQARLAEKAGVARETIYRIERGRMPFGDTAMRLCEVLGFDRAKLSLDQPETDAIYSHPSDAYLRDRRRELGLTLKKVAAAAGISVATLSRFERNKGSRLASIPHMADVPGVQLANDALAHVLQFRDSRELTIFWKTGRTAAD